MRYRFGEFELDTDREQLISPAGPVNLRRQAYRVLLMLIERAPSLVSRDVLMDTLWGHHALSPNVIPQTISELRQALSDDPQQPRYVETRHRRGYAFIATVERIEDLETRSAETSPVASPTLSERAQQPLPAAEAHVPLDRGRHRATLLAALGVIALLMILLGVRSWRDEPPSAPAAPAGAAPAFAEQHLVLAFEIADPALAAYMEALARTRTDWVASRHAPDARDSLLNRKTQRLLVDQAGRWRLVDPAGAVRSSGALDEASVGARAVALLKAIAAASDQVGIAQLPVGWPSSAEGLQTLTDAILALEQGRVGAALNAFEALTANSSLLGWPQFFHAETLARSGQWRSALSLLELPLAGTDRGLELLADALRTRLMGRPAEAISALRAYALLVPESTSVRLAVLDAQLEEAQWDAAADSLDDLSAILGERATSLEWRRALWLAVMSPAQTQSAFDLAIAQAREAGDANNLRRAEQEYARWLLRRMDLGSADRTLAAMDDKDPEVGLLRGRVALERGDVALARSEYAAAQAAFEALGLTSDARRAALGQIEASLRSGEHVQAFEALEPLMSAAESDGDARLAGDCLDALGRAEIGMGKFAQARQHLQRAVDLAQSRADRRREGVSRYHLGNAHAQERLRPQEAEQAYRVAAETFRAVRDDLWEAKALGNLALMSERSGHWLQARDAYATALDRMREHGVPRDFGRISMNAGVNERELGDLAAAATHLDEAIRSLDAAQALDLRVIAAAARADVAFMQADMSTASRVLDASEALSLTVGPLPQSVWLTAAARRYELGGDREKAADLLKKSGALRAETSLRTAQLDLELRQQRLGVVSPASARKARFPLERIVSELQRMGEIKYALSASLAVIEADLTAADLAAAYASVERLRSSVQSSGNRAQQLQLDWLAALSSEADLRDERLAALIEDANKAGFTLLARVAEFERCRDRADAFERARQELVADGLIGATQSTTAAF